VTEEPELPLAGLDAERPLPLELRARLEAVLLGAAADGLPVPSDGGSLDAPRPLPEPLRARLESALLAEAAASASTGAGAAGAEAAAVAATVTSFDRRRRRTVLAGLSAVAAVLLVLVGAAGLLGRNPGRGPVEAAAPTTTTALTPAPLPSGAGVPAEAPAATSTTAAVAPADSGRATPATRATRPAGPTSTTAHPGGPGPGAVVQPVVPGPDNPGGGSSPPQPAGGTAGPGPAPPFYNSAPAGAAGPAPSMAANPSTSPQGSGNGGAASPQTQQPTTAPAGPPLRIGIVTGDPAQEAGFRAYVDLVNRDGGVRGHSLDLVPVGPGQPATGTVATVNLSALPVAGPGGPPSWAAGPLLETLTATENLLPAGGPVFDFASPPERQGHLAVDAVFPSPVSDPSISAVIYAAPSGPLHDTVPAAIESALAQQGVKKVTVVTYDPDAHKPLLPGDAAFVSLDPAAARAWVAEAKAAGYRPARGVAGIYSLADVNLAPDLPEGARVISPYVVPGGDEGAAIRSGAGGTSAPVLHGWATAKSLAAAIWRTGAETPAQLQTALEQLAGWSSGLAPPYETRPGTRSRTPEGVVLQVQNGAFTTDGSWRRDPAARPV